MLIDKGAQLDQSDSKGITPLMSAITNQDYQLVTMLLEKGASVVSMDHHRNNALCHSAMTGNPEIVERILRETQRQKIDVDQKNMKGVTPLLIATQNGHLEAARILVEKGHASLTIRDLDNFMTPEEWMKESSFYTPAELHFLSPKNRRRNINKNVKTLSHYLPSSVTKSSKIHDLNLESSLKLPRLSSSSQHGLLSLSSNEDRLQRSMFGSSMITTKKSLTEVPTSLNFRTKRNSFDHLPKLQQSSKFFLGGQKEFRRKRSTSNYFSKGSLEPIPSCPGASLEPLPPRPGFRRLDSVNEDFGNIKP
jgi:ankyrin repeat protein